MNNKTKVLIIDDDMASIEKLNDVLSDYPDLEIVGNATLCKKGEELVSHVKPDLLFLDIELPDGNGLDFIRTVKTISPATYIYRRHRMLSNSDSLRVPETRSMNKHEEVFTAATYTNELRVMRLSDIGYFRYSMRRKVWEVALNDHSFVQLKRGTSANDILQYSPQFVQTHQSYIVNMHYLLLVGTTKCRLYPPFDEDELPIGRTYGRDLRHHFQEI